MKFVSIDTETTGLSSDYDSILEIGAVEYDENGFTGRSYHKMYYPRGETIPAAAHAVHGITIDMVMDCMTYGKDNLKKLLEFVGDAQITGYNIKQFDSKFLGLCPDDCVDVMHEVQKLIKGKWIPLRVAYEKTVGGHCPAGHRALGDATASAMVHMHLMGNRDFTIPTHLARRDIVQQSISEVSKITCNLPKLPTLHY